VACFYELEGQLVIHPEECIDCMACVDECPVHAIYAEGDVPPEFRSDIEFNATEARRVQESGQGAIETKKDPLPTARPKESGFGLLNGPASTARIKTRPVALLAFSLRSAVLIPVLRTSESVVRCQ